VAEVILAKMDDRTVGYALFFRNYSTFLGRPGIYLEDLFVLPASRGLGIGRALLAELASIAVARGCGRLEWAVLDWNETAIGFYRRLGADVIAVGHTEDDQAETFLLKLARGAGLTGLGAVYPRRGAVVRPLIDVPRGELRVYLQERGEPWVEDETNADLGNPRNRVRHRVLPELDAAYGGPSRPGIARAATLIREDAGWIDAVASDRYPDLCATVAGGLEMDAARLTAEPPAIRRRVLLRALRSVAGEREIGLDHIELALEVAAGRAPAADLPGSRLELRRGKLVLLQQDAASK